MGDDYKKYDSQALFIMWNARLAKEPQVVDAGEKELVKLTVVCTSRSDRHSDLWVELTVQDRQADLAKCLEKGDTFGFQGFPALRRWGDNDEKISFEVNRAELFTSIDLFVQLKERGFEPAAKGNAKGGKKAPAKKPAKSNKRPVQDLDDDLPAEES